MIKNSIIGCDSLTGGLDSLEDVDHDNIFGDGSNIPVKDGDICYVIIDGGPSYCYMAKNDLSPVTDGYRKIAMLSGGTVIWECQFIADLIETPNIPKLVQEVLGTTPPVGFRSMMSGYAMDVLFLSGNTPSRDYPLLALYNNTYLFIMTGATSYEYVYRLDLTTGDCDQKTSIVFSVYYPAGCKVTDSYYMLYDTNSLSTASVYFGNSSNSKFATPIPGVSRYRACAAAYNGKGYIFGGVGAFLEVYEHDRTLDSFSTSNPAAYVRKADLPREVIDGGAVTVGDKIYIFHRDTDIRGLIYDPIANTWDDTTIPDYSITANDYIKYNTFYDSVLHSICISLGSVDFPAMQQVVIGYDIATNTWSVIRSQPFDMETEDTTCVYDPVTDTTIHTMDSEPYVVRLYKDKKTLCVQDT